MVAEVLINENVNKLNKTFDYNIPKEMEDLNIGSRVKVIFNRRKVDGFVLNIKENSDFPKLNNILEIIANDKLSKFKISLAKYISEKYFASFSSCIKLFLNPGNIKKNTLKKEKQIAYILNNDIKKSIKDYTNINPDFNNSYEEIKKLLKENFNLNINLNHFKILMYFIENKIDLDYQENIINELEDENISKAMLSTMCKNNIISKEKIEVSRNIYKYNDFESKKRNKKKHILNSEQKQVFDKVLESINKNKYDKFLLFGVTGSGKTEVYMQIIEEVIKKGKNAIMLVPEIGLTPQMEKIFSERFGSTISIMHSRLTDRERFDEWNNIQNGERKIVIGTRSAIFAPIENLGIIIIDEQHDFSYLSGSSPRYDAKEIANKIAKHENAVYLEGSATPLVTSMYEAINGDKKLLKIKKRVLNLNLPSVETINMRTNKNIFSNELINHLKENIDLNKQSLIFLNKRGFSSFAICKSCGFIYKCPNCSVNLNYHKKDNAFKCHYCGYYEKKTDICPKCNSPISFIGMGTQKVEENLLKIFDDLLEKGEINRPLKTLIMDQDSVSKSGGHKEIIEEFVKYHRDVLIGTQMIAKGHNFPDVNMVSVILADNILNTEFYNGAENAFQTLIQVIGRSGRSEAGKAIIQTYNPDNYIIELAKKGDYLEFYKSEIEMRKALNYPPFTDILTFQILSKDEKFAEKIAIELSFKLNKYLDVLKNAILRKNKIKKDKLSENNEIKEEQKRIISEISKIQIFDPMPYRINKINNIYRWKITMKTKYTDTVNKWIKDILASIKLGNKAVINLILNDND